MFFASGQVLLKYETKDIGRVSAVIKSMPITGGVLLLGGLALTGSPPFSIFISEFSILSAGFRQGYVVVAIAMLVLIALIFVGFLFYLNGMVFGKASSAIQPGEISYLSLLAMGLSTLLIVSLGVFIPAPLGDLLHQAAAVLGGARLHRDLETLSRLLLASSSHRDRLEGTGILSAQEAGAYCAVGPIGRSSGVDRDLRRDHPYAAYMDVNFAISVAQEGDALARTRVRLEEAVQALHIIDQVVGNVPGGSVRVPLPQLSPGKSAFGWAESARGECIHWLLVGEDGTLARYRVRPASFANWQAFSLAIPGHNILTDFPVIEQSFGLSFAGADC